MNKKENTPKAHDKPQSIFAVLRTNKEFLSNPITITLSAVTLFFLSQLLGSLLALPIITQVSDKNFQLLAILACSTSALYLVISLIKKLLNVHYSSIGLVAPRIKSIVQVIPAFILYFLVSAGFTILAINFLPGFNSEQAQDVGFIKETSGWQLAAAFFSLVIITPIFEETIFRGLLFKRLRSQLNFKSSVLIASIVFAVAHMQWNVALDTFALSLVLCWLVERSGSIAPAIALHALKNGLAFLLLFVIN